MELGARGGTPHGYDLQHGNHGLSFNALCVRVCIVEWVCVYVCLRGRMVRVPVYESVPVAQGIV